MSKTKTSNARISHRPTALLIVALVQVAIMLSNSALAQNKQSSPVSIEANVSLEWDQTKGVYIAIGDAVVEQDDKRLKVDASHVTILIKPRLNDVVFATGSVVFIDGDVLHAAQSWITTSVMKPMIYPAPKPS